VIVVKMPTLLRGNAIAKKEPSNYWIIRWCAYSVLKDVQYAQVD